jgi:rhodanese-related sulfurtransferase
MAQLLEFASNHLFLVSALIALVVLVIVNELRIRASGGRDVTPAEAVALINSGAVVVDVRNAPQFAQGHVLNARNVPLSDLNGRTDALKKLGDKALITYCDTGTAGARAAASLRKGGFGRVVNLRGGLAAWQRDGLPIALDKKTRGKGAGK